MSLLFVEALRVGLSPRVALRSCPRCGVSGVAPNAPKPDEAPSGMGAGIKKSFKAFWRHTVLMI
jgi:hypothetical protein